MLGETLVFKGYNFVIGGMDNYLVFWDLCLFGLIGSKMEYLCDFLYIILNKNVVFGDVSVFFSGGVRIGVFAMTFRGFVESDFV